MGISLVCRMGPWFSLYSPCYGRQYFCQTPAIAYYEGMVHETRWPATCLRVEFQRCKSAGTGMGGHGNIPHRKRNRWGRRYHFFKEGVSKTPHQFYLVDK